jgi:hypothetical protein
MSMGDAQPRTWGEVDRGATILPLRRAFASQFVICVLLRPVRLWRASFSSSVGYGCRLWAESQFFRILTDSLEKRAPVFGMVAAARLVLSAQASDAKASRSGAGMLCSISGWIPSGGMAPG